MTAKHSAMTLNDMKQFCNTFQSQATCTFSLSNYTQAPALATKVDFSEQSCSVTAQEYSRLCPKRA